MSNKPSIFDRDVKVHISQVADNGNGKRYFLVETDEKIHTGDLVLILGEALAVTIEKTVEAEAAYQIFPAVDKAKRKREILVAFVTSLTQRLEVGNQHARNITSFQTKEEIQAFLKGLKQQNSGDGGVN